MKIAHNIAAAILYLGVAIFGGLGIHAYVISTHVAGDVYSKENLSAATTTQVYRAGSDGNIIRLVGPLDIYPGVSGSINSAITQANIGETICNKNWSTSSERPPSSYTTKLKLEQIKQYGYTDTKPGDYEEDHLVSLELGGNPTDPHNLWPEPYTPALADGGARTKDKVEGWLKTQVCAGTITLEEAQYEIATDWYKVYVDNLQGKYGSTEPITDDDDNG